MSKKIYLSPAAHATDNKTKCPMSCGENIHCNQYIDIVEKRLKEVGFEVKRGSAKLTGSAAMSARVKEANDWKADYYYAVHTNAGGGRYSMTMCDNNATSKKLANVIHKYRKCVSSHKVVPNNSLYEINATKMPCLYDELFFHDNTTDCKWFHNGGMELLAEETVKAFCEMAGVKYKAHVEEKKEEVKEEKTSSTLKVGDKVALSKDPLYASSTTKTPVGTRTGTYYIWSNEVVNKRVRITNSKSNVGKAKKVTGWVNVSDIAPSVKSENDIPQAGDKVTLKKGRLYVGSTGTKYLTKTGTYYLYDGVKVNGRYRVTNALKRVGKKPVTSNVSGWVTL